MAKSEEKCAEERRKRGGEGSLAMHDAGAFLHADDSTFDSINASGNIALHASSARESMVVIVLLAEVCTEHT